MTLTLNRSLSTTNMTRSVLKPIKRLNLASLMALLVFVAGACEKKKRSCDEGQVLKDGECVPDEPSPVEEEDPDPNLAGDPFSLQDKGRLNIDPGQQGDKALEDTKQLEGKAEATKGEVTVGDVECSSTVTQGTSSRDEYLKCLFTGGTAADCYGENTCKVTMTTQECTQELTEFKADYPDTATTYQC